jgi:transcriptional regulator with XRE-family HTH domain
MTAVCSSLKNNHRHASTGAPGMPAAHNGISRLAINDGDRQLRRTCARFGEELHGMRLRTGLSQAALARAIGVTRSVVCRLEQGDPAVTNQTRARAAAALGADFRVAVYPAGAPLIHDAAHARLVEALLRKCDPRWRVTVEAPVPGSGRRSTDVRLDSPNDVVLMEIETHVQALEAIIREGAEKRVAHASEAPIQRIHSVLVLPPTRHHRALVASHPRIVAATFPTSSEVLLAALADPDGPWPGDGILWVAAERR